MDALALTLIVLGLGFLVANLRLVVDQVRFLRRRRRAVLIWPRAASRPTTAPPSRSASSSGCCCSTRRSSSAAPPFGEGMMFLYYGYLLPLSLRIRRGFYEDGMWTDSGFMPYDQIGGISWREDEHQVTLIVISRLRNLARRLAVPLDHYGAARRLLRDKIKQHAIQFAGTGLDLGEHDERDNI